MKLRYIQVKDEEIVEDLKNSKFLVNHVHLKTIEKNRFLTSKMTTFLWSKKSSEKHEWLNGRLRA